MARQFDHDRRALGLLEVDADAAFAPIVVDIAGRLSLHPWWITTQPGIFAVRRHLELDHLGAKIGKDTAQSGTCDILRNVQNANTAKVLGRSLRHVGLHRARYIGPCLASLSCASRRERWLTSSSFFPGP